ncbi:hypothetical protein E2562_030947 [Oryza meyeriana var. granulata]|uniref:Uncharacterized protein n=1 Tax=Oryza meyeriana var. granulata TaxID=110450 RepID=A0A6G1E4J4_9ORYZ|nr:hypothetical protein E2562_030947 [Oryza meyeriana var. granulata]
MMVATILWARPFGGQLLARHVPLLHWAHAQPECAASIPPPATATCWQSGTHTDRCLNHCSRKHVEECATKAKQGQSRQGRRSRNGGRHSRSWPPSSKSSPWRWPPASAPLGALPSAPPTSGRSSAAHTSHPSSGLFTCSTAPPTPEVPTRPRTASSSGLFHSASDHQRALRRPPRLALDDITFATDIAASGNNILSFAIAARNASPRNGVFQFGVDMSDRNTAVGPAEHWSVRLTAVRAAAGVVPAAFVMIDPEEEEMPNAAEIGVSVDLELPAPGGCDWGGTSLDH